MPEDSIPFGAGAAGNDITAMAGDLADAVSGEVPDNETVRDAEVVCIIRPKDAKLGTKIVIIHRASSRFVNYLQGEVKTGTKPTSARFPFDPTMNLGANLDAVRAREAAARPTAVAAAPAVEQRQPAEKAAPVFERYRRSPESR
jgi:hypothetical protein